MMAAMEKRHHQGRDALLEIIKIMHEGRTESVKFLTERMNVLGDDIRNLGEGMNDMEKRLAAHTEKTVDVHRQETKAMKASICGDVNTLETDIRGELNLMKMSIRMFWIPTVTILTLVAAVAIRTFGPDILVWLVGSGIAP